MPDVLPSPSTNFSVTSSTQDGTEFSYGSRRLPSVRNSQQSVSMRSMSSTTSSHRYKTSRLRNEVVRSPEDGKASPLLELFPYIKARLSDVPFRTPQIADSDRSPDTLRRQMLSVVFGWDDDIEMLIRDECKCPFFVLLLKKNRLVTLLC